MPAKTEMDVVCSQKEQLFQTCGYSLRHDTE